MTKNVIKIYFFILLPLDPDPGSRIRIHNPAFQADKVSFGFLFSTLFFFSSSERAGNFIYTASLGPPNKFDGL
jgi:hypothetical protein